MKHNKLLIDEPPLQVLPTLAAVIGLNDAIILQQLHYWLMIAEKSNDPNKFVNGTWWTYNTYEDWQDNFPFWSTMTIRRIIYSLEKKGLIISRQMRSNKYDATKWYTLNYDRLEELIDVFNLNTSLGSKRTDHGDHNEQLLIPETSSETTTEIVAPSEKIDEPTIDVEESVRAIQAVAVKYEHPLTLKKSGIEDSIAKGACQDFDLKEAYEKTFHVTPNWESLTGRRFLTWLKERPPNETIDVFARYWFHDDWRGKQGQPPTISQVREFWPQAFQGPRVDPRNIPTEVY